MILKKAVWPSGQCVWLTIWWSLSPGGTLYKPCCPKGDGFCAVLVWKLIGSGFKELGGTTLSRIPRSTPRTDVKTFHKLEWCYLLYPWFGKYGEEEDWIFKNTQKLADRKSNQQSLSLDWQLCFLSSCFYQQRSAFMSIPPPLSAGDFSCVLSGSVKSL